MKSFDYAELFLNTDGQRGEQALRDYIANGGDINERDRDGMSAMDIALDTERQDKKMRAVAPRLVKIISSLS